MMKLLVRSFSNEESTNTLPVPACRLHGIGRLGIRSVRYEASDDRGPSWPAVISFARWEPSAANCRWLTVETVRARFGHHRQNTDRRAGTRCAEFLSRRRARRPRPL